MKFIRKNGRVIPIRDESAPHKEGVNWKGLAAGVGGAALAIAATHKVAKLVPQFKTASSLKTFSKSSALQKSAQTISKKASSNPRNSVQHLTRKASSFLGLSGPYRKKAERFQKAAQAYATSPAPDASKRVAHFQARAAHALKRASQAEKLGYLAGQKAEKLAALKRVKK